MKSINEIEEIRKNKLDEMKMSGKEQKYRVVVGMATCGIAAGANPVMAALKEEIKKEDLKNASVTQNGCIGVCRLEPIVEVYDANQNRTTYVKMTPEKVERVVREHLVHGNACTEYTIGSESNEHNVQSIEDASFFKGQERIALRNCGIIDPENIDDYLAMDGFKALEKVLKEMTPEQVIDTLKKSGLRGRGGAGFSTGMKWEFTAKAQGEQKYICCNADEGDPGAFMDRSILEGDSHAVIEAMAIAGFAVGSDQGYIYVRAEYPIAVKRLNIAIDQAREYGLLGDNILGTGFKFDLELRLGAGAFVCGEETALMTSIEGKRGEPRPRPPFPAIKGLWGKPTLLNNVETYANVPQIILKGDQWFAGIGTEKSKGTKVFAVGGKINNTGLVEIPMGTTLRKVLYDLGGGIPNGKKFKSAQTGGPSGGCIPAEHLDTPIEYDTLVQIGSMMGSGGLIVMDEDNCMVDIAKFFLEFTVDESCGKCPPCRIGTKRMLEILNKITEGRGETGDIKKLEKLANSIKVSALCGLGQTAPNPVLSTLRYFRDEFEVHINEKRCPAGACKAMLNYNIDESKCKSCGICAKNCVVNAINGQKGKAYVIDNSKCAKCGVCETKCPVKAIGKS